MGKTIKLSNENYLDTSSIMHNSKKLNEYLNFKGNTLKCGLENNQNFTNQTLKKVNFNKYLNNNFNNDYENNFKLNDGCIEIMSDYIKCVIVVVSLQFNGFTDGYVYITKKNVGRFATIENYGGGVTATAIIPVSKGDKIFAEIYAAGDGAVSNWADATFVEVVAI